MGTQKEYVKIMIDRGNTVGDLVSEEFAERLGLEGDDISDHRKGCSPGRVRSCHRRLGACSSGSHCRRPPAWGC